MTIRDLLIKGEKEIEYLECKLLLSYLLDCDENYITINGNKEVSPNIEKGYFKLIKKVVKGTPLQYITHKQAFYKRDFYVNNNVLIPQPDTEVLVYKALELMNKLGKNYFKILDLCTGSRQYSNFYSPRVRINKKIFKYLCKRYKLKSFKCG